MKLILRTIRTTCTFTGAVVLAIAFWVTANVIADQIADATTPQVTAVTGSYVDAQGFTKATTTWTVNNGRLSTTIQIYATTVGVWTANSGCSIGGTPIGQRSTIKSVGCTAPGSITLNYDAYALQNPTFAGVPANVIVTPPPTTQPPAPAISATSTPTSFTGRNIGNADRVGGTVSYSVNGAHTVTDPACTAVRVILGSGWRSHSGTKVTCTPVTIPVGASYTVVVS